VTTISGIDSLAVLRQNLAIARGFEPMTAEKIETRSKRGAVATGDGYLELYESRMKYDGDVGRGAAGFAVAQRPAAIAGFPLTFSSPPSDRGEKRVEGYSPALSDTSRAKPAQSMSSRPLATVAVSRSWIKRASGIGTSPSLAASRTSP
jgi:hypothetical protein